MDETTNTKANRARLLDLAGGGSGVVEIKRHRLRFERPKDEEPDANYDGPILVPPAEWAKFEAAAARYYKAQGLEYDGNFAEYKFARRTHQEAVDEARKAYAARPCLVRHADGYYYMHNEDKERKPTIIDVLIDEILQ